MTCYHPQTVYRSRDLNPSGKRSITWNPAATSAFSGIPLQIPCGQCIGCKLERSRNWAIRCVHEAQLHEQNSFLTLTYDEKHLPSDESLHVSHHQNFMKRLRKFLSPKKVRFFHCGEYGEKTGRPHYHTLLFGHRFSDMEKIKTVRGHDYYTSAKLGELWQNGMNVIGEVTFESAAYVARYITKKITGPNAERFYEGRKPEYVTMSRRPGIAQTWFDKYKSDLFPDDFVVIEGRTMPVPRFYLSKLSESEQAEIKAERHRNSVRNGGRESHLRMLTREECHELKADQLKRSYEQDA